MSTGTTWTVRNEEPGDAEGIDVMLRRAFRGDNAADLVRRLRAGDAYDAALSWVAVEPKSPGRVVGHVLFSPIAIVRGEAPAPALALAPLGVMPDRQRLGIGTALVRRGLQRCRERGYGIVLVLGDPGYYVRFGFVPASEAQIAPANPAWAGGLQVLGLRAGALDRVRGIARYPPAFDDA